MNIWSTIVNLATKYPVETYALIIGTLAIIFAPIVAKKLSPSDEEVIQYMRRLGVGVDFKDEDPNK